MLSGCLSFSSTFSDGSPQTAEHLFFKGDAHMQDQNPLAVFVSMVGIEGPFDPTGLPSPDRKHPLAAVAAPWLQGMAEVDDDRPDGRLTTWTSAYVDANGTFYGIIIPGNNGGVGSLVMGAGGAAPGATSPNATGGLRPCAAHLSQWNLGSADAMTIAMADEGFAAAVNGTPELPTVSVLWMGERTFTGCSASATPFWWLAHGDLRAAFVDPSQMHVVRINAASAEVLGSGPEWLRLRAASEVGLYDDQISTPAIGSMNIALGDVAPLSEAVTLSLRSSNPLASQYTFTLVGPEASYDVGAMTAATPSTREFSPPEAAHGEWSLEITAPTPGSPPITIEAAFTSVQ